MVSHVFSCSAFAFSASPFFVILRERCLRCISPITTFVVFTHRSAVLRRSKRKSLRSSGQSETYSQLGNAPSDSAWALYHSPVPVRVAVLDDVTEGRDHRRPSG